MKPLFRAKQVHAISSPNEKKSTLRSAHSLNDRKCSGKRSAVANDCRSASMQFISGWRNCNEEKTEEYILIRRLQYLASNDCFRGVKTLLVENPNLNLNGMSFDGRHDPPMFSCRSTKKGLQILKLFISYNVDVNSTCKNGNHILTAFLAHPEFVNALLRAKADPNAKDAFGNSALWLAARGGNSKAILSLIESGADIMHTSPARKIIGESVLRYDYGCYGVDGSVAVKSRRICNSTEAGTNALQAAKLHFPSEVSSSWEKDPTLAINSIQVLLGEHQKVLKRKLCRDISMIHMLYDEILHAVGDEAWCYGGLVRNWDPKTAVIDFFKATKKYESKEQNPLKIYLRINPKNTWQVFQVVGYYEGQQTQIMGFQQEFDSNQVLILRQVIVRKCKSVKKGVENITLGPRFHLSIRDLNSKTYTIDKKEGIHFGAFELKRSSYKIANPYSSLKPRVSEAKEATLDINWDEKCELRINASLALDRRLGRAFVLPASSWGTSINEDGGE